MRLLSGSCDWAAQQYDLAFRRERPSVIPSAAWNPTSHSGYGSRSFVASLLRMTERDPITRTPFSFAHPGRPADARGRACVSRAPGRGASGIAKAASSQALFLL